MHGFFTASIVRFVELSLGYRLPILAHLLFLIMALTSASP
jgi:hypothetical protein